MTTATKLNREGVRFIEKTHIVKRMSPKCHLKEDISRSFKLPTLPTPTQRRANTLTVIIDYTKPLVDDKWWPFGRHWKGKHNRRRARTRDHAKRKRRMHTNLNANPRRTRRRERNWERQRTEQRYLEEKNWWLWSLIKGNEDALHKKIKDNALVPSSASYIAPLCVERFVTSMLTTWSLRLNVDESTNWIFSIEGWQLIGVCPIVGYKPDLINENTNKFGVVWDWTRYRHGEPRLVDGIALSSLPKGVEAAKFGRIFSDMNGILYTRSHGIEGAECTFVWIEQPHYLLQFASLYWIFTKQRHTVSPLIYIQFTIGAKTPNPTGYSLSIFQHRYCTKWMLINPMCCLLHENIT